MADEKIYGIKDNKSKVEVLSKTDADNKFKDINDKIGAIDTLLDELNGEVI